MQCSRLILQCNSLVDASRSKFQGRRWGFSLCQLMCTSHLVALSRIPHCGSDSLNSPFILLDIPAEYITVNAASPSHTLHLGSSFPPSHWLFLVVRFLLPNCHRVDTELSSQTGHTSESSQLHLEIAHGDDVGSHEHWPSCRRLIRDETCEGRSRERKRSKTSLGRDGWTTDTLPWTSIVDGWREGARRA